MRGRRLFPRPTTIFIGVVLFASIGMSTSARAAYRIVALGDSITYGTPDPAVGWLNGLLHDEAGRIDVENAGVPGERTDQMLARVYPSVVAQYPRLVFVMGGTNDISQGVPLSAVESNLGAIVDRAQASDITVILLTIPPRGDETYAVETAEVNSAIWRLGALKGVQVVDIHGALSAPDGTYRPGMTVDGVHPSKAGYAVIAETVRSSVIDRVLG
jgi:lysophospholipase L1-like esterase